MQGEHLLTTATGAIVLDRLQWSVPNGYYHGLRVGAATPGSCYRGTNRATAFPQNRPDSTPVNRGPWSSSTRCHSASGGNDPEPGNGGCVETEWYACPPPGTPYYDDNGNLVCYGPCVSSPIIIGLERGRYRLTDAAHGVRFDLDADGRA